MADEQETIAETGQETATEDVVETEELDTEAQEAADQETDEEATGDDVDGDEAEEDADQPDDGEYAIIDIDGEQYQVPKALEGRFLMHKDYTQKTQETAAERKELEAERERIAQQAEATDEYLDQRAELRTVERELERFKDWGWEQYQAARRADPMGADEAWQYRQHLIDQQADLKSKVGEWTQKQSQTAQQDLAKRIEETRQFASQNIPGWSPETDGEIIKFAEEQGIPKDFIAKNISPLFYGILHKAMVGQKALTKQAKAITPAPKPKPKPATRIAARTSPGSRKSVAEMTVEDHARAEEARLRRA